MGWVLTRGLTRCRACFNKRFPNRDKTSDGTIGNQAHQAGTSGHNPDITGKAEYRDGDSLDEVRAVDLDNDLRDPDYDMEALIQFWIVVLGRQRGVLQKYVRYVIYNRRIWRAATGWKTEAYTGASQHTEHIHVSGAYSQFADNDETWTWGLDELVKKGEPEVTLSEEQIALNSSSAPLFKAGRKSASAAEFVALGAINSYRATTTALSALAAIKAVGANDAQVAASLAAMQSLLNQIAQNTGAFTPEQLEILKNAMKDSAAEAGAAATQRLEESLNSLRAHLGDQPQQPSA